MIHLALLPFVILGVIISVIIWGLVIIALISFLSWNLVLGFLLAIALLTGVYHWWYDPDET